MTHKEKVPYCLKALGREQPPATLSLPTGQFQFVKLFKHDFFALTALYEGPPGKVVLKVGRKAGFLGFPCWWMGRVLARRETAIYRQLQDVEAVPKLLSTWGEHGFVHAYVEGHQLQKGERVAHDFFSRLREALGAIHRRGTAYVDLEKPQNVIVGADGRPYLIDFQIAWHVPKRYGGDLWPARLILRWLQEADLYHLAKLQRRTRPDQLSPEELAATYGKPWYICLHRWLTRPARHLRRWMLNRLDPGRAGRERGSAGD